MIADLSDGSVTASAHMQPQVLIALLNEAKQLWFLKD